MGVCWDPWKTLMHIFKWLRALQLVIDIMPPNLLDSKIIEKAKSLYLGVIILLYLNPTYPGLFLYLVEVMGGDGLRFLPHILGRGRDWLALAHIYIQKCLCY